MPLDLPCGITHPSFESRHRAGQPGQVEQLAEPAARSPPTPDFLAFGCTWTRCDRAPVLFERNSRRAQRTGQQTIEMVAVGRQDRILAPRRLDPEFGLISGREETPPIDFLGRCC